MSGKFMMNGIEYLGGGSGGGGGNVDDVLVNGVSVVNEDKKAEIVSYKEVTQSEYEALPDTKLTDGIAYFIKDSTEAEGFPPLIYNDSERQVGVWRDGKPLYEKTIHFIEATEQTDKTYTTEITSLDPDHIILVNAEVKLGAEGANGWYTSPFYYNNDYNMTVTVNPGGINIYSRSWKWTECYATVRYTKSTDTPGSGLWAGNGALAHHYSTKEVIVGTWIDRKPLYERTFAYNISPVNDWTLFDDSVSYDLLIDARGYHKNSFLEVFPLVASDATNPRWCIQPDHKLYYFISNNTARSGYITIQYTKTTD